MKDRKLKILYCSCSCTELVTETKKKKVQNIINKCNNNITIVHDMCNYAVFNKKFSGELKSFSPNMIIACYPRTVKWLLKYSGITLSEQCRVLNLREISIVELEKQLLSDTAGCSKIKIIEKEDDWTSWFPVIDYTRCSNCKQCASFCLFGVYEIEKEKITVKNPENCKDNCPACARICPEAAIIFPKSSESPINGDEIRNEEALKDKIKLNVDSILGDDIATALRARRKKVKSGKLIKEKVLKQALKEREKCSKGDLDPEVPPEWHSEALKG